MSYHLSPLPLKFAHSLRQARRKVITGDAEKRVRDFVKEPLVVQTMDKFSFTLGVGLMLAIQHMMLVYPAYFGHFYFAMTIPLIAMRYYLYTKDKVGWEFWNGL